MSTEAPARWTHERRHALLIAADTFDDPQLQRLRSPARDAASLADLLRDPGIGAFEVEASANQPERVVRGRLERFFADAVPDELLLLYIATHGIKDLDGRLYFAEVDSELGSLEKTSLPADFVRAQKPRWSLGDGAFRGVRLRTSDRLHGGDQARPRDP
jgi:Caspase domain